MKTKPTIALAAENNSSLTTMITTNKVAMVVVNGLLFQLGWFSAVLGGNSVALSVMLALLIVHQFLFIQHKSEWLLIALVAAMGIVIDTALSLSNILVFQPSVIAIPAWLFCIWVLFACTINHSLSWLKNRPVVAILIGAVAGPSSYFAGSKLSDVAFAEPLLQSLAIMVMIWALLLPLLMSLSNKIIRRETNE